MTFRSAAIAGTTLLSLILASPAFAAGALTAGAVSLLAGPGPTFDSVGKLEAKTKVGLLWCGPAKFDWCLVTYHKVGGWVHTADLLLLGASGEIIPGGAFGLSAHLGGDPSEPEGRTTQGSTYGSGGLGAGGVGSSGSGAVGAGVGSGSGGVSAGGVGHGLPGL